MTHFYWKLTRAVTIVALLLTLWPATLRAQNSDYFTVVLFGDPEIELTDRDGNNATVANIRKWFNGIINMHQNTNGYFNFRNQPAGFTPKADLVICMGDMDGDSKTSRTSIQDAFDLFVNAGVPFFTMLGNHDIVPDYWNGGDKGVTWGPSGGSAANDHSFGVVNWYRDDTKNKGMVSNLKVYTQSQGEKQAQPFAFTFKGVRFYIGQTYWFQKTYNAPPLIGTATYYAPNGIISDLTNDVTADNAQTPAVWVQHYPINAADRWWNDTNANGAVIAPSNTPDYATADAKRNKYKDLISKTKNPYHFSGHQHWAYKSNYTTNGKSFTDYVAPYFATNGSAYIALCKTGVGVIEVRQVCFDPANQTPTVLNESQLSNNKVYTLRTANGNLVYDPSVTNAAKGVTGTIENSNPNHQWVIVSQGGNNYLYNAGAGKFARKPNNSTSDHGTALELVSTPDANCIVTLEFNNSDPDYPWVLKYGSSMLNVSTGHTDSYGLLLGGWNTLDGGNRYAISEVDDFNDFLTVKEKLSEAGLINIATTSNLTTGWYQLATETADVIRNPMLITSVSQLSSPKSDPSFEGNLESLIDGDAATYWHSTWRESPAMGSEQQLLHYVQFDLGNAYQNLTLAYRCRNAGSDKPTAFAVTASNSADGTFTQVATITGVGTDASVLQYLNFDMGAAYRYIRLRATATAGDASNRGYWHAAEMQFYPTVLAYYKTLGINSAPTYSNAKYDMVSAANNTDLSTLFYIEKVGSGQIKIQLPSGYSVGTNCSRTNEHTGNLITVTAPDADPSKLQLKNDASHGNNYWYPFANAAYPNGQIIGAGTSATAQRWKLFKANEMVEDYDVWTVAPAVEGARVHVTYSGNAAYTGVREFTTGGKLFLGKGSVPSVEDFTVGDDVTLSIDAANRQIVVSSKLYRLGQRVTDLSQIRNGGKYMILHAMGRSQNGFFCKWVKNNGGNFALETNELPAALQLAPFDVEVYADKIWTFTTVSGGYSIANGTKTQVISCADYATGGSLRGGSNDAYPDPRFYFEDMGDGMRSYSTCAAGDGFWLIKNGTSGTTYWNGNAGATFITWSDGHPYTIFSVEEVTDFGANYGVTPHARGLMNRSDARRTEWVSLKVNDGEPVRIENLQQKPDANREYRPIYFNRTGVKFTCPAGATLTAAVDGGNKSSMQALFFIDEGNDGFEDGILAVDNSQHKVLPGHDLKTLSGYRYGSSSSWYNSVGESVNASTLAMPAFTAPTKPGTYRVRYMVVWNSVDPVGYTNIASDGGIIVDATLEVTDFEDVTIQFVNDVTGGTENVQLTLNVGATMADALKKVHPGAAVVSASPETVVRGKTNGYTVHFEPDYEVTDLGNLNRDNRRTNGISLAGAGRLPEKIQVNQTNGSAMYWDLTGQKFTCIAGETLTAAVDFSGTWMNAYVYIDENCDGFVANDSNIGTDHVLKKGTDIDLRSYSKYNGGPNDGTNYDSNGTVLTTGDTRVLPSMIAPATPGIYRMRYKVDWNSLAPDGNRSSENHITANGGVIVDVMLEVLSGADGATVGDVNRDFKLSLSDLPALIDLKLHGNGEADNGGNGKYSEPHADSLSGSTNTGKAETLVEKLLNQ